MKKNKIKTQAGRLKNFFRSENYHFYSKLFILITPVFLQSVMESLVNLVDNFMVGILSDQQALNGVGTTVSIYNTVFFLSLSWSMAGGIYLSQYIGKKDKKMSQSIFSWQLLLSLLTATLCMIVSLLFAENLLKIFFHNKLDAELGEEKKILKDGGIFLRWISLSFPLLTYSMISFNAIYITGDTKIPFFISLITLFTNILIDPILMIVLKLGFVGAAIGTLISRIIECILITSYFIKKKPIFFSSLIKKVRLKLKDAKKIIIPFIPILIGEIGFSWAVNAQIFIMYRYGGYNVLTAVTINFTIMGIFYSIFTACSASVPYFISRYLGRNQREIARNNATKLIRAFGISGIAIIITGFLSADLIPFLFNKINPKSIELSQWFIRFQSFAVFWQILTFLFYSILRAGKRILIVTIADTLTMWVLVVGGSWLLFFLLTESHFLGLNPINGEDAAKYVIIYISLIETITTFIAYLLYKFIYWDRKIIL